MTDGKQPFGDLLPKLLPAGIVAGMFYAMLRLAYVQFYTSLGLLPEDVGIGRTELLAQAIVGPAVIGLVYSIILSGVLATVLLSLGRLTVVAFLKCGAASLAVAFLLTFLVVSARAYRAGMDVVNSGRSVRTVFLPLGVLHLPILDIRALPVAVEWKDPSHTPAVLMNGTECMFYLGEAGTKSVLYDVRTRTVVRLESADVIVVTSREPDHLPERCTDSHGPAK